MPGGDRPGAVARQRGRTRRRPVDPCSAPTTSPSRPGGASSSCSTSWPAPAHAFLLPVPTAGPRACWCRPPPGERAARPDRRGPRRPHRHGIDRRTGSTGCSSPGGRILPALARRGGHRGLRRPAGRHRAPRLPDPVHADQRYVTVGGIRSTGLTAVDGDRRARRRHCWTGRCRLERADRRRPRAVDATARRRPGAGRLQDPARIAADPAYGTALCHCEQVSRGEVRDACHGPWRPPTRRRPPPDPGHERSVPGLLLRCRGVALVAAETGIDPRHARRGCPGDRVRESWWWVPDRPDCPAARSWPRRCRRGPGRRPRAVAGACPGTATTTGSGSRTCDRPLTGPPYARLLDPPRPRRAGAGPRVHHGGRPRRRRSRHLVGPAGIDVVRPGAVVLATGARERPPSARLVPGDRPAGVFTTGQLQQWVLRGTRRWARVPSWSAPSTSPIRRC